LLVVVGVERLAKFEADVDAFGVDLGRVGIWLARERLLTVVF
jgi:hypothetical protein